MQRMRRVNHASWLTITQPAIGRCVYHSGTLEIHIRDFCFNGSRLAGNFLSSNLPNLEDSLDRVDKLVQHSLIEKLIATRTCYSSAAQENQTSFFLFEMKLLVSSNEYHKAQ